MELNEPSHKNVASIFKKSSLFQTIQNLKEQVNYLYVAWFSPEKATFIKAIKLGHFTTFQNLTTQVVDTSSIKYVASIKDRLDE